MSDLIDKRMAIKIAESYGLNNGTTIGKHSGIADLIAEELSNLPTIEAEPVRHGEWVRPTMINGVNFDIPHCSVCRTVPCDEGKYCPNRGAKMKGAKE